MNETKLEKPKRPKEHRLHAICPYYAMFPPQFARESIMAFTKPGDLVFDPFCGRGTTILEALLSGRDAIGTDINPVAAVISQAKASAPKLSKVISRINELETAYSQANVSQLESWLASLPPFFEYAYTPNTLRQILFLRAALKWTTGKLDRFICALVLGHLHGESQQSPSYLSNQMPHTIATKPNYSVRYWQDKELRAPERNVFELLRTKAEFRLEAGVPQRNGRVLHADARTSSKRLKTFREQVTAVITSPPYLNVTRFEEDQWLRLWFLGGEPNPTYGEISGDDRYRNVDDYFNFLTDVWVGVQPLTKRSAMLICRIGTMHISFEELNTRLNESICQAWPRSKLIEIPTVTNLQNSQTARMQRDAVGCEKEYDFKFQLNG